MVTTPDYDRSLNCWHVASSIGIVVVVTGAMLIHPRVADAPQQVARATIRSPGAPDPRDRDDPGRHTDPAQPDPGHTRIVADRRRESHRKIIEIRGRARPNPLKSAPGEMSAFSPSVDRHPPHFRVDTPYFRILTS